MWPGLSPLSRGTPPFSPAAVISVRFIPALAGNTGQIKLKTYLKAVYPRSRGEHDLMIPVCWLPIGLSPLSRGTPSPTATKTVIDRFIPALAGNTGVHFSPYSLRTVYPRSRGEHRLDSCNSSAYLGLSPLSRGTRQLFDSVSHCQRFIPALAGNTGELVGSSRCAAVYPRSRGEHELKIERPGVICGLSPLSRGTLALGLFVSAERRFIPALAGNTMLSPGPRPAVPVYPRSRGEHSKYI